MSICIEQIEKIKTNLDILKRVAHHGDQHVDENNDDDHVIQGE